MTFFLQISAGVKSSDWIFKIFIGVATPGFLWVLISRISVSGWRICILSFQRMFISNQINHWPKFRQYKSNILRNIWQNMFFFSFQQHISNTLYHFFSRCAFFFFVLFSYLFMVPFLNFLHASQWIVQIIFLHLQNNFFLSPRTFC